VETRPETARCPVLGVAFYAGGLPAAAHLVIDRARAGGGGYACLSGVHGVTMAQRDPEEGRALREAWMNFPDGAPIAWRQRRAGLEFAERVAGPDLMPLVIDGGREAGLRHFLFGSTPEVLGALAARLAGDYPGALIVGSLSPPFRPLSEVEEAEIAMAVLAARPHIVWVGLGAPKQDLWMQRNAHRLPGVLCMGVGAAFDFLSGNKVRAPGWMQRAGLEWLHRLTSEPRKLGPRYLRANSRFVTMTSVDMARQALAGRRRSTA
jgi:N-acetylglucosaminyldiphosphoundecaprenol N-acetyl-beta-D-mannosaminyltransferase